MATPTLYEPSSRSVLVVTEVGAPGWVTVSPGAATAPGLTEYEKIRSALWPAPLSRPGSQTAVRRPRASYVISVLRLFASTCRVSSPRSGEWVEVTFQPLLLVVVTVVGLVLPPAELHGGS